MNQEPEKALADYNMALKMKMPSENTKGNLHMMRAFVNKMLGNEREACADYKIARQTGAMQGDNIPGFECPQEEVTVSAKPDDYAFERFMNEGNDFVKEKKFTEALQMYDKALLVCNATNAYRVITAKGGLYYILKEYDKAIEEYTKALTVKLPDDKVKGYIYSMRSFVHKSNGNMGFYCADYHFARNLGVINDDDTRKDDCE